MALHSIFGATTPPGAVTSYTDAGSSSVLLQQFYIVGAPTRVGWTIGAVRIWIPAGSPLIGRTGSVGLIRRAAAVGGIFGYSAAITNEFFSNGANRAFTDPLVAGWNERPLAGGPWPIENNDGVLAGYSIGGGYLYSSDMTANSIGSATASNLYLCEIGSGPSPHRTFYSDNSQLNIMGTAARFYGVDIVVDDGASAPIPTGSFGGEVTWGPASAAGAAPVSGTFNGTYGWRPAEASGTAPAAGAFGSQIGWGAAVASGETKPGGAFTGEYGWRPAASAGERPALGTFSAGYRFGPAVAGGSAPVGGAFTGSYGWGLASFIGPYVPPDFCWPAEMYLDGWGPGFTLTPEGPAYTLEVDETC
jgi:hypothetical protein